MDLGPVGPPFFHLQQTSSPISHYFAHSSAGSLLFALPLRGSPFSITQRCRSIYSVLGLDGACYRGIIYDPTHFNIYTEHTNIFVCTSNTCRSPMAEQFANAWLDKNNCRGQYCFISRALSNAYEPENSPAS